MKNRPEAPFLAWCEAFEVSHDGLAVEHRRLVALVNEIYEAECVAQNLDELRPLLNALKLATVEHFEHENSVMRRIRDGVSPSQESRPDFLRTMSDAVINEHYAEHARDLIELDTIIRSDYSVSAPRNTLSENLKDWFVKHAVDHDAHLKAVFQVTRSSAIPL